MVLSNVIVDVTIPCRCYWFVFGQWSAKKVSAGFTNVRSLACKKPDKDNDNHNDNDNDNNNDKNIY